MCVYLRVPAIVVVGVLHDDAGQGHGAAEVDDEALVCDIVRQLPEHVEWSYAAVVVVAGDIVTLALVDEDAGGRNACSRISGRRRIWMRCTLRRKKT